MTAAADRDVRRLLGSDSRQRAQFAAELERELHRIAPDAEELTGIVPQLDRGWQGLEPALDRADGGAVLAAVEAAEAAAGRRYEAALGAGLPPEIRLLVEAQAMRLADARDRIRQLVPGRRAA